MIVEQFTPIAASEFAGACAYVAYITVVELPARLALDPRVLLAAWTR